jgi:hypothetical protein
MEGPEAFTANATWNPRDQQIGTLYGMYLNALKDANALDFDDLLLKTVELFEQSEHVRDKYSEKFRFLMGRLKAAARGRRAALNGWASTAQRLAAVLHRLPGEPRRAA